MREGGDVRCVYFVQALRLGLVKIGIARDVPSRMAALQTGSPDTLTLIGAISTNAPCSLEKTLHMRFAAHRRHGEWFEPAEELLAYLRANATVTFDRQALINSAMAKIRAA